MALKRKTDEAVALPAEPPITWRNMTKVPLEVRRGVLRAALELRVTRATAALDAIKASEALEEAGCDASALDAFDAARRAHNAYDLEDAFNTSINEVYLDALSDGAAWAETIAAELRPAEPPVAPAADVSPAITSEEMPF